MYSASRFQYTSDPIVRCRFVFLGPRVSSRQDLFDVVSRDLAFPDYFGENWDAFVDCMSDLSWIEETEVVVAHDGLPLLPSTELRIYLECLQDVLDRVESRGASKPTLRILFRAADRPGIEALLADSA